MMRFKNWMCLQITFLSLAGTALVACTTSEPDVPRDAVELESRTLLERQGTNEAYHERARLVIRDADEWEQHWQQLAGDDMPSPVVDFDRDMVLLAAMGERSSGGYGVTIEGAFDDAGTLYVPVLEISPGSSCGVPPAVSAPVIAVAVPRMDGPVVWVERSETRGC